MLNLELIPFIGYEVKEYTPDDKYEEMDKETLHTSLLSKSMENKLATIKNFRELKTSMRFQEARNIIHKKDFLSISDYNNLTSKMADEMGIKQEGVSLRQKLQSELNVLNNKKGKFVSIKK